MVKIERSYPAPVSLAIEKEKVNVAIQNQMWYNSC